MQLTIKSVATTTEFTPGKSVRKSDIDFLCDSIRQEVADLRSYHSAEAVHSMHCSVVSALDWAYKCAVDLSTARVRGALKDRQQKAIAKMNELMESDVWADYQATKACQ